MSKEKKEKTQLLIELTNKFLSDFFKASGEDKLFAFSFILPEIIAKSNFPKYKEKDTLLMGMASFDDSIAKQFFNIRLQGFVKLIENKIAYKGEQEDYYIKNIQTTDFLKDDFDLKFEDEDGNRIHPFKVIPTKTKVTKITFDVSNSRNGFHGSVQVFKEIKKVFTKKRDKYTEKLVVDKIDFINNAGERVMSIDYKQNDELTGFYEVGTFTHYKYIADINSFFIVISCV